MNNLFNTNTDYHSLYLVEYPIKNDFLFLDLLIKKEVAFSNFNKQESLYVKNIFFKHIMNSIFNRDYGDIKNHIHEDFINSCIPYTVSEEQLTVINDNIIFLIERLTRHLRLFCYLDIDLLEGTDFKMIHFVSFLNSDFNVCQFVIKKYHTRKLVKNTLTLR